MSRIDAEVWLAGHDADSLWRILARNRFEGAVAFGDAEHTPERPWILGVVGETNDPRDLDRWQRHSRFRGVRGGIGMASEAARRGLACDFTVTLEQALNAVEVHPLLRLAVTLANPELARVPNVMVKIGAGWQRELLEMLGEDRLIFASRWPLGLPDRTWKQTLASFTQILGAQSIETREKILGGNAKRFYGIE